MTGRKKPTQLGRMFLLIETLAPHVVHGLSVSELARKTGISPPNVCRYMDALAAEGMAEKIEESNRWSLTEKLIGTYRAYDMAAQNHDRRRSDFRTNVEARAYRLQS